MASQPRRRTITGPSATSPHASTSCWGEKAGIASPARRMGQGVFARDAKAQARQVLANAEVAAEMMVSARQLQEGAAASMRDDS